MVVHTKKKMVLYDPSRGRESLVMDGVSSSCNLIDHEGNLWIGTVNKGVFIVPNQSFTYQVMADNSVSEYLKAPNGDLYFFTEEGKFGRTPFPYRNWDYLRGGFTLGMKKKLLPEQGRIYFSDKPFFYDLGEQKFIETGEGTYFRDYLPLENGNSLLTGGSLVLGMTERPSNPNELDLPFQFWGESGPLPFTFPRWRLRDSRCKAMELDPGRKDLYVGFVDGLIRYTVSQPPEDLLLDGKPVLVREMLPDPVKGVWMLTEAWQLLKLEGGEIVFQEQLGRNAKKITTDGKYVFWIQSKEVVRLEIEEGDRFAIDYTDGLMEDQLIDLNLIEDTLYLLGEHLVQRLPKAYDFRNPIAPEVTLDAVHLYNEELTLNADLEFSADENFLTFYFHALAFRAQQDLQFEYRILGSKENWQLAPAATNHIDFPQLSPGDYTFQLRALNEDGVASSIVSRAFVIHPPIYQRWWFQLFIFGGTLLLIWLVWRYRMRQIRKENRVREEQERLQREVFRSRIAALRSQMNPHFIFNALNSIQEFIITQQKNIASEYLADFAELMRNYLEQSKHEEISLSEEIETLEIYLKLENLRFDGALNYQIVCPPSVPADSISIPVMLLQPFVENAIKHGLLHKTGDKKLLLAFEEVGQGRLACIVEDNGIGREAAMKVRPEGKHNSFATEAMQKKVALVNQTTQRNMEFKIEDLRDGQGPSGTRVTICLDF